MINLAPMKSCPVGGGGGGGGGGAISLVHFRYFFFHLMTCFLS